MLTFCKLLSRFAYQKQFSLVDLKSLRDNAQSQQNGNRTFVQMKRWNREVSPKVVRLSWKISVYLRAICINQDFWLSRKRPDRFYTIFSRNTKNQSQRTEIKQWTNQNSKQTRVFKRGKTRATNFAF